MKYQCEFDSKLLNKKKDVKRLFEGFLINCDSPKRVRNGLHLLIHFSPFLTLPFFYSVESSSDFNRIRSLVKKHFIDKLFE